MALIVFIVAALCALLFFAIRASKSSDRSQEKPAKQEDKPLNITVSVKSDKDMEYYCRIAGVQHHCTSADAGGFLGIVAPQPENKYGKDACAVYRNGGQLVGYIPKDELEDYRQWSGCTQRFCVGFIKVGDEALFGKVKVINADDEDTELILAKYVRWLVATFGRKYVPEGFELHTDAPLKTKQDWLDALDEYIEEHEGEDCTDDKE